MALDQHHHAMRPSSTAGICEDDDELRGVPREVCADDMTLAHARWWIVNDWRDAP